MKRLKMVLMILLVGVVVFGCGVPKSEVDELLADLEKECDGRLAEQRVQLEVSSEEHLQNQLSKQRAELETDHQSQLTELKTAYEIRLAELEAEKEYLSAPTPQVSAKIVGQITFWELVGIRDVFFPEAKGSRVGSYVKGPYPLVGIETLLDFLGQDKTNVFPNQYRENVYNLGDEYAFTLKHNWLEAGLPGHSLALIKARGADSHNREVWYWLNLFITRENGELVVYRVEPTTDQVTRIEASNPDPTVLFIHNTDYVGP